LKRNQKTKVKSAPDESGEDDEEMGGKPGSTGTIVKPRTNKNVEKKESKDEPSSSVSVTMSGGPSHFSSYYKTGKQLEVNEKSSLVELRKGLITLNKAYERELTELDAFYNEKRKQLQALIAQKEKEDAKAKNKPKT